VSEIISLVAFFFGHTPILIQACYIDVVECAKSSKVLQMNLRKKMINFMYYNTEITDFIAKDSMLESLVNK